MPFETACAAHGFWPGGVVAVSVSIGALEEFRDVLARADRPALEEVIVRSEEAYRAWLLKRASNRWDDSQEASDAPRSAVMDGLLGSYLSKRLRGGKQP